MIPGTMATRPWTRRWSWFLVAITLLAVQNAHVVAAAADNEEPTDPVCRFVAKNSLSFCSMVDYHAVLDKNDPYGSIFDARAKSYYENVNIVLNRFGCNSNTRYSLYSCDHCRDAYKYWVCSIKFQRCGTTTTATATGASTMTSYKHTLCPHSLSAGAAPSSPTAECVDGVTGRHRTCLSLCEDVVRKCPYILGFQCPTTETVFFSADIAVCNKLDREKNPDKDSPWPGTFADA